ncbi:hypothetical protein FH966_09055 [Lentibacillus cibarius]|uniref:YhcN/YlaJ family sporulation lipoprotein n=1 Tax=Lentibacillus cibarius TaxID=2583219 RepID=A0A549YIY6_9BACI|nr:YhcN/YlaJ family sporulation lipoprotein [Lentibacillus cibarius]TRM11814.1 hypothetical protein FH966_09055 [Lentibacillus cibarius]
MKWKILSILFAAVFVLGACQADNDDPQNNNNGDDNVEQTRYEGDRDADNRFDRNDNVNEFNNGNRTRDRDNRNNINNGENQYELADEAADRITDEVDGVKNVYVMKTDNNAYVAARLDNDNNVRNNNNVRNDNNIRNNNDTADNNNYTNNNNATNINRDRGQEVTDEVKNEITRIVKSVDSDVDNVYVSTNPDFFDLAGNYADDVDSGKPVRGLFDQMGNMIERVFPQNKR